MSPIKRVELFGKITLFFKFNTIIFYRFTESLTVTHILSKVITETNKNSQILFELLFPTLKRSKLSNKHLKIPDISITTSMSKLQP